MMHLVLFVLHNIDKLDEVLDAWESVGVSGVTIMASTGLARMREQRKRLAEDTPIFPRLEDFLHDDENTNRTLFAIVPTSEMAERLITATEQVVGNLDLPHTGILAVLPVAQVKGLFRQEG